jgi:hypothetical protein
MELGREIDCIAVFAVRFRHNVVAVGTGTSDAASASDLSRCCSHHFVSLPLLTGLGHELFNHYPAAEG